MLPIANQRSEPLVHFPTRIPPCQNLLSYISACDFSLIRVGSKLASYPNSPTSIPHTSSHPHPWAALSPCCSNHVPSSFLLAVNGVHVTLTCHHPVEFNFLNMLYADYVPLVTVCSKFVLHLVCALYYGKRMSNLLTGK